MSDLISRAAIQTLFNEASTSLLSKPNLTKEAEHMVRAFIMTTQIIQDVPAVDAVPVSELIKLRDTLYKADAITMAGLFQLNMLIAENSRE